MIPTRLVSDIPVMGVRRGGQEGALDPPGKPIYIVCFLHFFDENSIFMGVFGANSMFLPP